MITHQKPKLSSLQIKDVLNITIWGVGLIGGSVGLALKKKGFQGKRVGLGRNTGRLEIAQQQGAVDEITIDVSEGIQESDLVILCPPVNYVPMFVKQIIESVESHDKHIVLTDVGSTKSAIVRTVDSLLHESPNISFVGGHPMAGSHETGVSAASAILFNETKCILTPTENTDENAFQLVKDLWEFLGAKLFLCSPEVHDEIVGAASHLPHLIASILANCIADVDTPKGKALDFTATGFKDTTRIAAGSPELWTNIFMQNAVVLSDLIDTFIDNLTDFKTFIQTEKSAEIHRVLTDAQAIVIKKRETLEIR